MPQRLPPSIAAQRATERRSGVVKPGVGHSAAASAVPKPPRTVKGAERRAWIELADQVERAGTYNATTHTSFRMMVKTAAALESMDPAKMRPTAYAQLQRAMRGWLASFGLTAAEQAGPQAPTQAPDRFGGDSPDPVEKFLFEDGRPKLGVVKGGRSG